MPDRPEPPSYSPRRADLAIADAQQVIELRGAVLAVSPADALAELLVVAEMQRKHIQDLRGCADE